jgi:O-antigen/teichoic acid export membrane protein
MGGALGFYVPATAATRAIGLARGIILARLISETEFGLFQLTLLVINLLNPLCALGLNEGIVRYVPMYETRGTLRRYLRHVVPIITAISLAGCAVVFLLAEPLGWLIYATVEAGKSSVQAVQAADAQAVHNWTRLTRIAAGASFGLIEYFLLLSVFKGLRMFRAVSLMELLNNIVFTGLTIVVALAGFKSASAMTWCSVVAMLLMVPAFALPLQRFMANTPVLPPVPEEGVGTPGETESPMAQLLRFSTWAAVAAVIWQVLQYYPMWYLQKTHGAEATAVFAAVRLVTQVVVVGAVTVAAVVQTTVTKTWESQGPPQADRQLSFAYKSTSLFMLVCCVLFAALADPIMGLFRESYHVGVRIVPMCLMFFLISGHLTFLGIHFALIEKMRHLFWPWMGGLVANVVLSVLMVAPGMGREQAIVGAAWAGALGLAAAMLWAICLLYRERRPIDRGTVILWAATLLLVLPVWAQAGCLAGLAALVVTSETILSDQEKAQIVAYCTKVRSCLPWGR